VFSDKAGAIAQIRTAVRTTYRASVRHGDNPSSCHYRVTHHPSLIDLSLLRSGGSFGGSLAGPRVRERISSALHQPREPVLRARLLETFEHPNLKRKLRDRGESAFAVRMDAEPRQSSGCRREIQGRHELFGSGRHAHLVKL